MDFKIAYRAECYAVPPEWGNFSFRGEVGRRIDLFIENSINSDRAFNDVLKEAESFFISKTDDEFHFGLWRGEFWGKLMLSAIRVCRMRNNAALRNRIRNAVNSLLQYQHEDGYLNTYKDSLNIFRADTSITIKECGWANYYNWNIWCRKYTLWALLEASMLLDDNTILLAADKMGTQLLSDFDKLGARVKDSGVMSGLPSCSVLKPMLLLYRLTGKEEYLAFSADIVREWDREDNECPNLIRNALSGTSPYRWYPDDNGNEWIPKAYEMMSCFDGLCEYYRISGERRILEAAEAFFDELVKYDSNVLGSVSYCERFAEAAIHPDAATEECDIIHWMRLCYELFSITGKEKYMQSMETAFVNAYLAGMYADGKSCAFFIRSHGRHWDAVPQVSTKYQHCCLNNLPRGFVNATQAAVMRKDTDYLVNFYLPAHVRFEETDIVIGDGYTSCGTVTVTVDRATENSKLILRIPEWSNATKVIADNGKHFLPKAGTYFALQMHKGRNSIRVVFDMTVRILDTAFPVNELSTDDYHIKRWLDSNNEAGRMERDIMLRHCMSTVRRGPVILARSKRTGCSETDMFSQNTICGKGYTASAVSDASPSFLFKGIVTFTGEGRSFGFAMCDFASAANFSLRNDSRFFTLFV